ncbi:unnamed protein product [Macrosiphum euphorbiae]|uniref:Uncharacterized protein n=1 Tax=Macrosiphum euphorbiae TaxID=13131 RepID=A0AAV0WFV8_9HEMI|nr:unnamed protein product [Macrosiphum euphorbiae]
MWSLKSRPRSTIIPRYFILSFGWMVCLSSVSLGVSYLYLLVNTIASVLCTASDSPRFRISSETKESVSLAIVSSSGMVFPELTTKVSSAKPISLDPRGSWSWRIRS